MLFLTSLTVALLCMASIPTCHARPLQRSSNQTHLDGTNKKWPSHVPLTRDHATSLIPRPLQRSTNQTHLDRTSKKRSSHVPLTRDHATSLIPRPLQRSTNQTHLDRASKKRSSHVSLTRDHATSLTPRPLQRSTNQTHLDRTSKKRSSHVPLTRDHATSRIPHFRRRGLLPKYRRKSSSHPKLKRKLDINTKRKSVTQSEWKRIMDSRKIRDDVINAMLEDREIETGELESFRPANASKLDVDLDTKRKSVTLSEWKRIMDARKIRDGVINAMLEDREIETEELEGVRPANTSELLERATEMRQVFDYMNGSDGHIWSRKARWAQYDPNYDWENGGKESILGAKQESKFEKYAKNWQKHTLKFLFAFSFTCMLLCCCAACCKKVFGRLCGVCCWQCKEWRDVMLNRDPAYRRIRSFADNYGLNIDYAQYKKLKGNYESALSKQEGRKIDLSGRN